MMELHDLACLVMKDCKEIQVAGDALEMQFPKFRSLIVSGSSEVGRLVLEDLGKISWSGCPTQISLHRACQQASRRALKTSISTLPAATVISLQG